MPHIAKTTDPNSQQRLNAKSIARILSVVTVLMLATGLLAVSSLTGGSRPPRLELATPPAVGTGSLDSSATKEGPIQVLLPERGLSEITPLEPLSPEDSAWQSPPDEQLRPVPIRTAEELVGPRYR